MDERVVVRNSLLYTGEHGLLLPASDHPEDPWDFNVLLDSGRLIGVTRDQVEEEA